MFETAHRIWLRVLYITLEKEINVLDFAYGLNCYCSVLFDYFSLLLRFLTSLIKLILWLKFFHKWKAGRGHGGGGGWEGPEGPALFHSDWITSIFSQVISQPSAPLLIPFSTCIQSCFPRTKSTHFSSKTQCSHHLSKSSQGKANTLWFPETFSSWPHILHWALFLLSSGSTDCFSPPVVPKLLWASQSLYALSTLPETLPLHPALSLQLQFSPSPLELE